MLHYVKMSVRLTPRIFAEGVPILKGEPTHYSVNFSQKLPEINKFGPREGCMSLLCVCLWLFLTFVPVCTYWCPLHLLAPNIYLWSYLCPSDPRIPFLLPSPCAFTSTFGPILSFLHCMFYVLC